MPDAARSTNSVWENQFEVAIFTTFNYSKGWMNDERKIISFEIFIWIFYWKLKLLLSENFLRSSLKMYELRWRKVRLYFIHDVFLFRSGPGGETRNQTTLKNLKHQKPTLKKFSFIKTVAISNVYSKFHKILFIYSKFFSSHKRNQQITFNVMFFYCDGTGKVSVVCGVWCGCILILWRFY